jgi:hypothetical protein
MNATPLREFARNEVYGAIANGLSYWWVNSFGASALSGGASTILGFRVWNHYNWALFAYESANMTIDGFVARGNANLVAEGIGSTGLYFADYYAKNLVITNANLQGLGTGIIPSTHTDGTTFVIRDSYLRNGTDIAIGTLWTSGYRGDWIPDRTVEVRNVRFDSLPGLSHVAIAMQYNLSDVVNLVRNDRVFVYDYDQNPGDNFRLYYAEQSPNFIVSETTYNSDGTPRRVGIPGSSMSNQSAWAQYGIALAGAVLPPDATNRSEIIGFVRPIA